MRGRNDFEFKWLAGVLMVALVGLGACRGRTVEESYGEVSTTWTPPSEPRVAGVLSAEVSSAIAERVAGKPPEGISAARWKRVQWLYEQYPDRPLWLDEDGLDEERTAALGKSLASAQNDALSLDGYPLAQLTKAVSPVVGGDSPSAAQLAEADVLLTATYIALAEDLLRGQTQPKALAQEWFVDVKRERTDSAVTRYFHADELEDGLNRLRPEGEEYRALQRAMQSFRAVIARGGWNKVPSGKAMAPGDTAETTRLAALRERLSAEGLRFSGQLMEVAPGRAIYDPVLAGGVAWFQAHHGIAVDSILGKETVDALNVPAEYRLGQIAGNLERMRWLPRTFGERYILVNVPAFRVDVFERGRRVLQMKTIVGQEYEGRRTPVFADSMEYVVFRPYWNVTPDIQAKELEPKIAADPGYMARNDYEYWQEAGVTRIRQKPGDKNSLGFVKFMFPNTFNIYLHDTPEGALFDRDVRAFSHGCIRLEKPDELAQWVLGWDADSVRRAMEDGRDNVRVDLPHKIPVYITYLTTYTSDGELYFGNDLYSRDEALVKALEPALKPDTSVVRAVSELNELLR